MPPSVIAARPINVMFIPGSHSPDQVADGQPTGPPVPPNAQVVMPPPADAGDDTDEFVVAGARPGQDDGRERDEGDEGHMAELDGSGGDRDGVVERDRRAHRTAPVRAGRVGGGELVVERGCWPGGGRRAAGRVAVRAGRHRRPEQCRHLLDATVERFGRLDLLVNNAGWTTLVDHRDLDALTDEIFRKTFEVNVFGTWQLTKMAMPLLRESQADGGTW